MQDCKNCELNMRGMLIGRLNVRPYKARKGMARRAGLVTLRARPARPWARPAGRDLVAATVRAMGKGDWTMTCQADFFTAQEDLAHWFEIKLVPLEKDETLNPQILNWNRTTLISAVREFVETDAEAERKYYAICAEILRGYAFKGFTRETARNFVKMEMEKL